MIPYVRISRGKPSHEGYRVSDRRCSQRVRSGGPHTGRACCRYRRAAATLDEVARPAADGVWPITRMLPRMIWWLQLAEIVVWVLLPVARMPANAEAAFYFTEGT